MNIKRLDKVIENMKRHQLEQMIISNPASIFYLTGKWIEAGERMLVLYINAKGQCKLIINELFPLDDQPYLEKIIYNDREDAVKILASLVEDKKLGIDKVWPSHFLIRLMELKHGITFVNGSPIMDEVRMIKDAEEIKLMKEASAINDKVMAEAIEVVKQGYEEKKVCKLLADIYEKYKTYSFSFYPLIAYGANAAEPHHSSDSTMVKDGDSIILDIGGFTNGYCSDMTRTVFYRKVSDEAEKVYNLVLEANRKGIEAVKPGVKLSDIDKAARDVIENAGYGKYFTHRTGHNIGVEVHEFPDVSSVSHLEAKPGMIFSIEPGIYLPGKLGVRIEDLVLVTETGCEVLNAYPKELQII
ncbi:MAG: aminopeptidase P family protein [Clostridiales bacterium]|uniref:M24 family metallopeptidase n=1 Tax=Clostridium sp. N3C TaxID=1776758 RepID=UPI00092DF600|nr:Xaa-Pro peptidase family protein [Clostridium sp. N3C]NLZ49728.1 aminopeptidase P family protein [Clostridiales bacterium]SCN25248.1 putative peptidase [Clostridium sp. N3C]